MIPSVVLNRGLEPEIITYRNRVVADGGSVVNIMAINTAIKKRKADGSYSNIKAWYSALGGIKLSGSLVVKWYDITTNNNDLTTPSLGVTFSRPNWQANRLGNLPGIVFAQPWAGSPPDPITLPGGQLLQSANNVVLSGSLQMSAAVVFSNEGQSFWIYANSFAILFETGNHYQTNSIHLFQYPYYGGHSALSEGGGGESQFGISETLNGDARILLITADRNLSSGHELKIYKNGTLGGVAINDQYNTGISFADLLLNVGGGYTDENVRLWSGNMHELMIFSGLIVNQTKLTKDLNDSWAAGLV